MSKGVIALIGWLGVLSLLLILIASIIVIIIGIAPEGEESLGFIETAWRSLMRTLDPGTMGGDTGWGFRITMLGVTLGGIFIVSTLIGVLSSGIESKLDELRKGRSFVVEKNHTLMLGWSSKIIPIISELIIANENQKNPRIVILADMDKVAMEDEIKAKIPKLGNTKIICRSGSPLDLTDLEIVNPHDARSIIVISPDNDSSDIHVIKTILAITNNPNRKQDKYHIVAEIKNADNMEAASLVGADEAILLQSEDIISRITVQTCRQSGLSVVFTELLDFDGDEIYFQDEPALNGKTLKESLFAYEDSAVIGIRFKNGEIKVNPPMDTKISAGDRVIAISKDDDTIVVSNKSEYGIKEDAIVTGYQENMEIEKTIVLGWNKKGINIIRELENYVPAGSKLRIVGDCPDFEEQMEIVSKSLNNQQLEVTPGNTTERKLLESLQLETYDHIIVLCYSDHYDMQECDAKTLITLIHLRDLSEKTGQDYNIVSEMQDISNKELAEVTKADDFIVSDKLISLMLSQLSENKELHEVFKDLLDADGSEIYLKPALDYVKPGIPVNFYTILESAARKNEIAIGYRIFKHSFDPDKAYGVVVNPKKPESITFEESDKIIVLSED
jgi:voltage-gated potassium channel Kch